MEILNYHVSDGQSGIRIDRYLLKKMKNYHDLIFRNCLKSRK